MAILILRSSSGGGGGGGTGFAARPYFFQTDATRLASYVSGNVSEWGGSASNTPGSPLGFGSLMSAHYTNVSGGGSSYNDIYDATTTSPRGGLWNLAVWAYYAGNTTAQDYVVTQCMGIVSANPTGSPISGDDYQHIEEVMMNTAMIGDLLYSRFSSGQRASLATYINGAMTYAEGQDGSFWPFGDTHNNYNNNRFLALAIAGLCTEGWNASASSWRTKFETLAASYITNYTSQNWTGPQTTEGHYYATYIRNALWAMRQYDAVMGTTYTAQMTATVANHMNMALYQLRPHHVYFFHIGSEPANTYAPFHNTSWALWRQLMFCDPTSTESKLAQAIISRSAVYNDAQSFEPRSTKAFNNFYWTTAGVTASALSAKTDRRLVLPTAGGAQTFLRSSSGWDTASTCRAAVMFHHNCDFSTPAHSHDNPDAPGFQWGNADNFIVTDPEFAGSSGIDDEAGTSIGNQYANCVTEASAIYRSSAGSPTTLFNEDNTGAGVSHYYTAINAQPYWTNTTRKVRHYVWLDDLQVCVIWDRVTTSGADTKTWRLHVDSTSGGSSVAAGVATCTVNGSSTITLKVYDLFATSGNAMTATNMIGGNVTRNIYRISQTDTANDFISLKALGINGRLTAASLSTGTDGTGAYKQADLTINGVSRSVRFYDSGTDHCVVS